MKIPKLWRKKRGGKYYGSWLATLDGSDLSLNTRNAELARQRLGEALTTKKRDWPSDAELAAAALEAPIERPPAAEAPPTVTPAAAPVAEVPIVPDAIEPPRALPPMSSSPEEARAEAEATNAAAAETGGAGDEGSAPPEVSDDQLAQLAVEAQLWVAQQYARNKVYKGYVAPQLPPEAKAPLAEQWGKIIAYANIGAHLPPWVTGLLIPGVTIVVATATLGQVFAEQAAQQKRAAAEKQAAEPQAQAAA